MDKNKIKILFCGGATGGHLYPAIAMCEKFDEILGLEQEQLLFIGSGYGLESKVLPEHGYNFKKIWIRGIQRGWGWKQLKVNALAPLRIVSSLIQSLLYIKNFDPDLAIGTGGYSAGPPLYIAHKLDIPIFLQEQNVYPGMTNRLLARHAQKTYTSYDSTKKYLPNTDNKGIPLRTSLKEYKKDNALDYYNLEKNKTTIFMFGGSQGSQALNDFLCKNIYKIMDHFKCQFIWQTGQKHFKHIAPKLKSTANIYITPYIDEMDQAYSACDIVLCRAGALTLAELCEYGKPSILVPLPTAAENHQVKNAVDMEEHDAAIVILEENLELNKFIAVMENLFDHPEKLTEMGRNAKSLANPNAAEQIVQNIISIMGIE